MRGNPAGLEFVDVGWGRDDRVDEFRIVVNYQDGTLYVKTGWLNPDSYCSPTACAYVVGLEGHDGEPFKLRIQGRRADVAGKVKSGKRKFTVDLP